MQKGEKAEKSKKGLKAEYYCDMIKKVWGLKRLRITFIF